MESRRNRRNVSYIDENKNKKSNKWKWICLISFVLMIIIYNQVYILLKYTTGQSVTEQQIALYKWITSMTTGEAEVSEEGNINVAILGNILLSDKLQENYISNNKSEIREIFKYVDLNEYDYTIANLDMTMDKNNVTSEELFKEFNRLNINILNVATNGLSYSTKNEIKETIDMIKQNDMKCIGIQTEEENFYIIEKDNIKIALLSYIGNENKEIDSLNKYSSKQLDKDLKKIEKQNVDGTILFIDTLRSNLEDVEEDKKTLLKEILEKDIDVVISNDTIVQEIYSKKHEGSNKYIVYSLGDFIGHQKQQNSDVSKLLKISINKKKQDGKVKTIFDVSFDKTFVALSNKDVTKCKIVDLEKEIKEYNEQQAGNITTAEYHYLLDIQENIK